MINQHKTKQDKTALSLRTQIDLRRLRYVVEVARAESITTAAQTLAITQPALTRAIAELEASLGVKLFERLPRGVRATPDGERFLVRARKLIVDMDDLIADTRTDGRGIQGRLRIGAAPAANLVPAQPSVAQLAQENPTLNIETIEGSAQTLCPRLLRGELDLVFGSTSYFGRWGKLHVTKLRPMFFGCMVRKDHPLSRVRHPQEVDVLNYPLVMPSTVEPMFSDVIARYAQNNLDTPHAQYTTDNFELAKRLINNSDAFYPLHFPSPNFGNLREQFLIIEGAVEMPENHLGLAVAAHRPRSEPSIRFEELLMRHLHRPDYQSAI